MQFLLRIVIKVSIYTFRTCCKTQIWLVIRNNLDLSPKVMIFQFFTNVFHNDKETSYRNELFSLIKSYRDREKFLLIPIYIIKHPLVHQFFCPVQR